MSADNGIYIHKFRNGWKVCHAQAIENISYDADKSGYNKEALHEYFEESPIFKTRKKALEYATKLYDEIIGNNDIIEYGISFV